MASRAVASWGVMRVNDRFVRDRFGALRNLVPFLGLIWRTSPALTAATVVLRLARAVLPLATLFVGKLIIDEVVGLSRLAGPPADATAWLASGLLSRLFLLLGAELVLAVAADGLGRAVSLLDLLLSERFSNISSLHLMGHAATLDLRDLEDSETQDRLDRARRQASGRTGLISLMFGQAQDLVTLVGFIAGIASYAPWLIVLLAATLVPAFLGEAHFNRLAYALSFKRTADRRELDYLRQTGASTDTAKEVKLFGLSPFLMERYASVAQEMQGENAVFSTRRAVWGAVLAALGSVGYYGAYAWLAVRAVTGGLTVGDLTFLAASFLRLRSLLEGLLGGLSSMASQALYLQDLFSFLELRPGIVSPAVPRPFPRMLGIGIVFENVGFRYPGQDRWAVRGLSFEVRAGEVLALVGENGAGKTTIVKLLTRLYDPDEGRILLDGHDLSEYALDEVRGGIGVIFQDFVRYDLSAADNIAVGRIEARADRARIEASAARGMAEAVIRRLPRGFDQVIGRKFRGGVELSGGEWQKVAIARAYMRDAALLILDEPTAALDARAEYDVFERFRGLSAGRTAVLISHRFSSVRMADRIVVLANGRVEASGTHAALVAAGGRYAELFELQAAGYR
jgi:ATP-binding cassette subfamily B protein